MTRYVVRTLGGTLLDYPETLGLVNYKVLISGSEVFSIAGQLKIDLNIGRRSQASFMVHSDANTHFQQYERVTIFNQDGTLVFSGYLTNPQEQQIGFQSSLIHTLTAIDQHFLADKRIVAGIYQNKTCGAIVVDIYRKILAQEGVHIGAIYDGLLPSPTLYPSSTLYPNGNIGAISSITFAFCTVAEALDQLVTLASSAGIPYYWMIDEQKNLFFVPYTYFTNNIPVDGTNVDQEHNPCKVQRQNPKYRNREWLTGGVSQTPVQTQVFIGDGNSTNWTLKYAVASAPLILLSTSGAGQNLSQIVGLKGTNGSEYYWTPGDATISQDSGLPTLEPTQKLTVIYTGQFPTVISTQNNPQIAAQALLDGTSGIIEVVDDDKNLTDANSAILEASQLLTRYSVPGTQCQFTTLEDTYRPGQLITVDLPNHNLNNAQMLIESVSIIDSVDNLNIWYQVTAIQGPYDNNWVSFFSDLLRVSHPATNITVGSASTPPTAPTLLLKDAAIRFRLQTSGGGVNTQVLQDAAIRFRLQAQNTTSVSAQFTTSIPLTITMTPTVSTGGTYPVFSGPSSGCPSGTNGITKYATTSNQAIRVIVFSDNYNQGLQNTTAGVYGGNVLLYWSDLETSKGVYDWTQLETAIKKWSDHGKKAIVRISTCGQKGWTSSPPSGFYAPKAAQGTPQYVFDAGVSKYVVKNSTVPQYWNSTFVSNFQKFVKAFAAQYDGDSRIEFIQTAVGMGGECKPDTTGKSGSEPLTSNLKSIGFSNDIWFQFIQNVADTYHSAFTRTKLCMIPGAFFDSTNFSGKHSTADVVNYVKPLGFGLQNDGIGGGSGSGTTVAYTPPDSNWAGAAFISAEQRDPTSQTGDNFECDMEAMISYCQTSKPIYALCFATDIASNPTIIQKYGSTN